MALTKTRRKRGIRPSWLQVVNTKVVQAPIVDKKNPDAKMKFFKIGVKITMQDQTTYFWSKRFDTWTKTELGTINHYRSGEICDRHGDESIGKPVKTSMGTTKIMQRDYSHCPKLVKALLYFKTKALTAKSKKT